MVGHLPHQRQLVLDHQQAKLGMGPAQREQQLGQLTGFRGVHAGSGFVQQDIAGIARQHARKLKPATVGVGQAERRRIAALPEAVAKQAQGVLGALALRLIAPAPAACAQHGAHGFGHRVEQSAARGAQRGRLRSQQHAFPHGQCGKNPGCLEAAAQPHPADALRREMVDASSIQGDRTRAGPRHSAEQLDQRGLARSVRAYQRQRLTGLQMEADIMHGAHAGIVARQSLRPQALRQ
ncbi:hypothetical protein D3C71_1073950 [compost metagenome]